MKLHLPYLLRRAVVRALFAAATVVTTLASATHADMITPDGRTATQVIQSGNVYDVYTNTVMGRTGFNSFSTFDVYADTTANLHLADGTGRLINVVRDSSSHIDGVLNSYKDGRIGGDVYFLNPNGIFVGKTGVINVGSISMSTPTAAFVEQLIARDGSISATATQAVLAGDMPINEKGTISIKGKVNAERTVEVRAGKVEVKGGEINTGVKFGEMVNTGKRKVDTKGMSIQGGRLSFGKKPSKARRAVAKAKVQKTEKKPDIAIFADDVLLEGDTLNADWVYIDPNNLELRNETISGNYTMEARVIIIDNVQSENLTSFTVNAANVLADGTFAGNVSITLTNSNLVADAVSISATATTSAADAAITISDSTIKTTLEGSHLDIYASSESGNTSVDIQNSTLGGGILDVAAESLTGNAGITLAGGSISAGVVYLSAAAAANTAVTITKGSKDATPAVQADASLGIYAISEKGNSHVELQHGSLTAGSAAAVAAISGEGEAATTLGAESTITTDIAALSATAIEGNATVNVQGKVTGGNDVTITATTGNVYGSEKEGQQEMEFTVEGGGNAMVTVDGTVEAKGALSVAAYAQGTYGNATLTLNGNLTSEYSEVKTIGDLALARTEAETVQETDSEEQVNAKNKAYMERYAAYLKTKETAKGDTATINIAANAAAGDASVSQGAQSLLKSSLSTTIDATAAQAASVQLAGKLSGGSISATATGATSTLSVKEGAALVSTPHQSFVQDGTVISVDKSNGFITLAAKTQDDQPTPDQEPSQKNGVLLEVAGSLSARREAGDKQGAGEGGAISLASAGKLLVTDKATLDASSANGMGGSITLDAPEYELQSPLGYKVSGTSGKGIINLMNHNTLTGDDINKIDEISSEFISDTLKLSYTDAPQSAPKEWKSGFTLVKLSGNIELTKDVVASIGSIAIAEKTHVTGNGHSLTLTNSGLHRLSPYNVITIGKDVTIEDVKDFTFKFEKKSITDTLSSSYIYSKAALKVEENFKVNASGNISITMEGFGETYIKFGKNVSITADGDVTISATCQNGWGSNFLGSSAKMSVLPLLANLPFDDESGIKDALSNATLLKFEPGKLLMTTFKHILGTDKKDIGSGDAPDGKPQGGLRVSMASVTFSNEKGKDPGSIKGKNVTISSSSTAKVGGRKESSNGYAGISIGYIYNDSKVDLGKDLVITATGDVAISSTTDSEFNLEHIYDSQAQHCACGLLVAVGTDHNTMTIDEGVKIKAEGDISIETNSNIEAESFMSLGTGLDKKVVLEREEGRVYDEEGKASANNILMLGVNLLSHKSKTTIDGTLTSTSGNIDMKSEDSITSTLSMSGSLQYTLSEAEIQQKERKKTADMDFGEFLKNTLKDCLSVDLGIGALHFNPEDEEGGGGDLDFEWMLDPSALKDYLTKGDELYANFQNQEEMLDSCIALSFATDIVITSNTLLFNGKAEALNGSVTMDASSEIEAASGAEILLAGVPTTTAVAGAVSVPVVMSDTTAEIGSKAIITAGESISVSSSTDMPMSFDFMGWRDWAKFAKMCGSNSGASAGSSVGQAFKAIRGSINFMADYQDNGDFGMLDALTSSHASTLMRKTGGLEGDSKTIGGNIVVDVRYLNTKTLINDGATLKAGKTISADSSATGTQVTVAGQLPFFLSLSPSPYISTKQATSGFGGSAITAEKRLYTTTYIGAATLEAEQLKVDSAGDVFMLEMSLGGTFGSKDTGTQGAVNVIIDKKLTVSEIAGGANITLTGKEETKDSSITASDKSTMLNLSLVEADGGSIATGFGAGITINNTFTAAMLGNEQAIPSLYQSSWKYLTGTGNMPFSRKDAITLHFPGSGNLTVDAEDKGFFLGVGIAGAVQIKRGANSSKTTLASNAGVLYNRSETTARQYGVTGTGNGGITGVTTRAKDTATIVTVAGDASVNTRGKNAFTAGGAISVNNLLMDTTAYVTDCDYSNVGNFTVDASNTATVVAVDVAAGVGAATANIAAGSAWNSLTGNTGSYLTGGSATAATVSVTSLTNLTSFSCTLGAAVDITLSANGDGASEHDEAVGKVIADLQGRNDMDVNESNWEDMSYFSDASSLSGSLSIGEDFPVLMAANGGMSFGNGASISRNAVGMSSKAIVEGCTVTTPGALTITATDTSVITAVSVGAAVDNGEGVAIGAGGVFSFAPVSSTTEAALKQKSSADGKLDIEAGSLTLHAEDKHRERVWSFGGGYGDTAGIGMVLSWGSFAGATTLALIENVNATVGTAVDILASSTLDSTFISVGASGTNGNAAVTGMFNYLNFNNHVITDIKGSTLTVTDEAGIFKALSEGKRTFRDGVGALGIRVGGQPGVGFGSALSFIYVGGNGKDDINLTQMLVSNSFINNSGTTDLLANSTTTGLLAGANAAVTGGGTGVAFTGSFSWVSDSSVTQVEIKDTVFNQRKKDSDKKADIKAEAESKSDLTLGFGSLAIQIGKGAGVGVGIAVLKDNATTSATMTGGGVDSAHDFTLHASGEANLSGLVIGGAGSGLVGVSGGAFAATITHNVIADLEEAVMKMNGALTVKADNTSNVGKGKGTRFTIANAAMGVFGGGVGVDVSCIDIADLVQAKAHNVSVESGSMSVLANETANADAVTVNVAGGKFVAADLNVVRPVLRGAAEASITSDQEIVNGSTVGITTAGDLTVAATNNQWMRSHLWAFALSVNPAASAAANLCANVMNLAGSSKASINGAMPLTLGGDLNVSATTTREATYTTVPVAASLGLSINLDVNSLRVSNDTAPLTEDEKTNRNRATAEIDREIEAVRKLINDANIQLDAATKLEVSADVSGAMSRAANAMDMIESPKTLAEVDLHGKTAQVDGNASIKATDTITTTPTTVPVTGGLLAVAPHVNITTMKSAVEATVNDTILNAGGNIGIHAEQKHTDDFQAVGVAVAALNGTAAVYEWTDNATTEISLKGGTKLKSTGGSINIGTDSNIAETFHHVNVGASLANIAFTLPTFKQDEKNTLTIGNGVGIEARKDVSIGTRSWSNLNATTYDITLAAVQFVLNSNEVSLSTTPKLTIGDNASITGGSVDIIQNINRKIGIVEDHIAATGLSLSFPFLTITDTVNATLSVGDGSAITATTGDLTIASNVDTKAQLAFLGVNALGISASGAKNDFSETVDNKTKLGKDVKLRAQNGTMTVRAHNTHKGDMSSYNIAANAANLFDMLTTYNHGAFTAEVSIDTGFDAAGRILSLEALNTEEYLCHGKKVTVSLAVNPYSKNGIDVKDTSTATITLAGGIIDVAKFNAKALTDVAVKVSQLIGGGSLTVDVNIGKVTSDITQTATITLGTGDNALDILTDDISVTAHNKHLFDRLQPDTKSMVYGGDVGLISGTSKGTVDARQNLNATVTLGSGSQVRRRGDAAHYLQKEAYRALLSATNNVDSNTEISLFSGGILNSNCILNTWDATTAYATLNLNGSIDTWGDTELTAYSHAKHNMINSVTSGSLIPTFTSNVKNTIDTYDVVNINGTVESIGNITIQSGSAAIGYKMVDGTAVLAGGDDTNTTNYFWGKDDAVIHNRRNEKISINSEVRAGGELAILNDSSANTVKKPFEQKRESEDYKKAAIDTAADVASSITLGAGAKLYAGLGSAVKMSFSTDSTPVLEFSAAQRIFDDSTLANGVWTATAETVKDLFSYTAGGGGNKGILALNPLTLPGMAFRIETKSAQSVFSGKLFSPSAHGLDVYFPLGLNADIETTGVILRGHETGLFFNRVAVKNAVSACAAPTLYLNEGVSIRSDAMGNLTLIGLYDFPYSTFHASSLYDLIINGEVRCGTTTMQAGGNFRFDNPNKDYSLQGPLNMYTGLFNDWIANAQGKYASYAAEVVANSGVDGSAEHSTPGCVASTKYDSDTYSDSTIRNRVVSREASINAAGTVDITAKIVDINGKIYSGAYGDGETITIKDGFKLLDAKGNAITLAEARAMYEKDNTKSIFKLDGYMTVTLLFDFKTNGITLSDVVANETGITITGTIVNSDPTGKGALYVMDGTGSMKVDNQTGYTLNIGNVDLSYKGCKGITLNNTGVGTATYTTGGSYTYSDCADYQVRLQETTRTSISESGRLTFAGNLDHVEKGDICNGGKVGTKETIIDSIIIETSGASIVSKLDYSYVHNDSGVSNGYAGASHSLSDKILKDWSDPGTAQRYKYELRYSDTCRYTLYINATNSIDIQVGGSSESSSSFIVSSGTVNFSGKVAADSCTVNAGEWIHAGEAALINAGTIDMTATKGSIGAESQALSFNARTASFSAGQDLFLAAQGDSDKLYLKAGNNLALRSEGAINAIEYHAGPAPKANGPDISTGGAALIAAQGNINVTNGHAAFTTIESEEGAITATYSTPAGSTSKNGPGILDAEAQGNIHISTDGALALYYVESRAGGVNLNAQGNITAFASDDLSTKFYAVPGSPSTSYLEQREAYKKYVKDEYYAKLLYYEQLYYEKDEKGNYTHRAADGTTFILPEEAEARAELKLAFQNLYNNGKAGYLSQFIYQLSGSEAVGGAKFANKEAAMDYLKQNTGKLENGEFANAYYNKLVADITSEVTAVHTKTFTDKRKKPIDFGDFDETVFRLYWLRDENGKLVNQDKKGNFISPYRDGTREQIYNKELCDAITKQFKKQVPTRSKYDAGKSPLLYTLADAMSGLMAATSDFDEVRNQAASQDSGKTGGDTLIAVRAATDITLTTSNSGFIGGEEYCFTINPIGRDAKGDFVYSDWATLYMKELSGQGSARVGTRLVYKNEETGECLFAMQYLETNASSPTSLNELELLLMQQAAPSQFNVMPSELNLIRVSPGGYVGVDAPTIHASGATVRLAANRDFNLGSTDIQATSNLALSTSGFIHGAIQGTGDYVSLYAEKGIGSEDAYFGIDGTPTFSIASDGDIFLKPNGDAKIDSLVGGIITVNQATGRLLPRSEDKGAFVIGQRINWHGSLDAGLNFQTYGGTVDSGGLHWYRDGRSNNIKFTALNKDYTFWFMTEDGTSTDLGDVSIGYSGHLVVLGFPKAKESMFHQVGKGKDGNCLELTGPLAFSGNLTFSGDGAFTVISDQMMTLSSGAGVNVNGDATLMLAGIDNVDDNTIQINSIGNLGLCGCTPDSTCEFMDAVSINGSGNVSLDNVSSAGALSVNAKDGIHGEDVSAPQIIANSSNGRVFLNADTVDLSGSSRYSFVADLEPLPGAHSVTVHDIGADASTSKVVIKAIADELLLDGLISAAALEFYSTGDINKNFDAILNSDYPFSDVWREYDPGVRQLDINSIETALSKGFMWFVNELTDDAGESINDMQELRRKVSGEDEKNTVPALRFTDKDGNTVSREQYSNLITNK